MLYVKGRTLLAHPPFLDLLERLTIAMTAKKQDTKLLAALNKRVFEDIPSDPTKLIYRQVSTLGDGHKHWFRAKLGNGRSGASTDAYKVIESMLANGNPPDDWATLCKSSTSVQTVDRLSL